MTRDELIIKLQSLPINAEIGYDDGECCDFRFADEVRLVEVCKRCQNLLARCSCHHRPGGVCTHKPQYRPCQEVPEPATIVVLM